MSRNLSCDGWDCVHDWEGPATAQIVRVSCSKDTSVAATRPHMPAPKLQHEEINRRSTLFGALLVAGIPHALLGDLPPVQTPETSVCSKMRIRAHY